MPPLEIFESLIDIAPQDIYGGHVNFSRYFAYCGEAFAGWYLAMGLDDDPLLKAGPLMAHLALDFLGEMTYPGRVLCRLTVVRVGTSSLEHGIEIRNADRPEQLCARGRSVNVWMDRLSGKAVPWPAPELAKCWSGKGG